MCGVAKGKQTHEVGGLCFLAAVFFRAGFGASFIAFAATSFTAAAAMF
jgi:hypothetical protein